MYRSGPENAGTEGQEPTSRSVRDDTSTRYRFALLLEAVATASVPPSGEKAMLSLETELSSRTDAPFGCHVRRS